MEGYVKLPLSRYDELIGSERQNQVFNKNYVAVCFLDDGPRIFTKEEAIIVARREYEKSLTYAYKEIDSYVASIKDFNKLPWYKRLFKKL